MGTKRATGESWNFSSDPPEADLPHPERLPTLFQKI